ncbi:MAG TPA: hypothetical protein VMW17_17980 [Candidatus Binatia bacterium]|nr:hypothetical protein [Candidatus Binatia bacterium]
MRTIDARQPLTMLLVASTLAIVQCRLAWAQPVLDITTPQGCGPGVVVGATVELIVRATDLPATGGVVVQITETNAFNQKFNDSTSLNIALPERTLTHLTGAPFPPGDLLITARIAGQSTTVSCPLTVAGVGTPTSIALPTATPPNAGPTPTTTTTSMASPTPSATPSQTGAPTGTLTPSILPSTATTTATLAATRTSTASETPTLAATATRTPTPSASLTASPSATVSTSPPIATPTGTPSVPPATFTPSASTTITPSPTATIALATPGDANCDGEVGAADLTGELLLLTTGGRAPCRGDDADGDGVLTETDIVLTGSLIFGP